MSDTEFVEVFTARDLFHANLIKAFLEEQGIEAMVENSYLQGIQGAVPVGGPTLPRIRVPAADAPHARELIAMHESKATSD